MSIREWLNERGGVLMLAGGFVTMAFLSQLIVDQWASSSTFMTGLLLYLNGYFRMEARNPKGGWMIIGAIGLLIAIMTAGWGS